LNHCGTIDENFTKSKPAKRSASMGKVLGEEEKE